MGQKENHAFRRALVRKLPREGCWQAGGAQGQLQDLTLGLTIRMF